MKIYMDCSVNRERWRMRDAFGKFLPSVTRWTIRDMTLNNKLIAVFSEAEFFQDKVNDFQIIRDWCQLKKEHPEMISC